MLGTTNSRLEGGRRRRRKMRQTYAGKRKWRSSESRKYRLVDKVRRGSEKVNTRLPVCKTCARWQRSWPRRVERLATCERELVEALAGVGSRIPLPGTKSTVRSCSNLWEAGWLGIDMLLVLLLLLILLGVLSGFCRTRTCCWGGLDAASAAVVLKMHMLRLCLVGDADSTKRLG